MRNAATGSEPPIISGEASSAPSPPLPREKVTTMDYVKTDNSLRPAYLRYLGSA